MKSSNGIGACSCSGILKWIGAFLLTLGLASSTVALGQTGGKQRIRVNAGQAVLAQESSATTYLDGIGRVYRKQASDPAGNIFTDTQYAICDCNGKTAKVSNPYRSGDTVYWTETQYYALGRVAKVIPSDGSSTSNNITYTYNLQYPYTTITDAAGKQKKYDYDILGRVWRVTEPDSSGQLTLETTYDYLPSGGQPGFVITQGSQTRTFVYDTLGRVISETHPESGTTTFAYDDNGNLTRKTDARGMITNYTYDELNRLTGKTYQNDGGVTPAVTMTYDTATNGIGKLAGWATGAHSESKSYDIMGRTVSETRTISSDQQTAQWSYGLGGQLLATTYPNGFTTENGYDAAGNLESIISSFAGELVTNIDRNAAGAWTAVGYGNGVTNTRTFNTNLQLASLRVSAGTNYFYKTYSHNESVANNGRIVSIADNLDSNKSISYNYDELNRLASAATSGSDWGLAWSYDRYGNRLSQTVTKGTAPANAVSVNVATNRVSGWVYDAAGNATNDGRNTYTYDAESRVISINGGATTYSYDAFGIRVAKTTGGTTVRYYFGFAEKTNGAWTKILVSTPAGVVEWDNGTMLYKSNDHLGSPRIITNSSGAVAGRVDLYPYGEAWSESGTSTKYKLTGKERDPESGLDYFGARYYYAGSSRWLSADSITPKKYDPQLMNKYAYVSNDPINYIDPDGRLLKRPECHFEVWVDADGMHAEWEGCDEGDGGWSWGGTPIIAPPPAEPSDTGGGKHKCVGKARVLAGNTRLIGKEGGFPGIKVAANSAAIIPDQWGGMTKAKLMPYLSRIMGMIGVVSSGDTYFPLFNGVTDVIGGDSPCKDIDVQDCLKCKYPDTLILEIPGSRDMGIIPITLSLPYDVPCPTGTKDAI